MSYDASDCVCVLAAVTSELSRPIDVNIWMTSFCVSLVDLLTLFTTFYSALNSLLLLPVVIHIIATIMVGRPITVV